MKKLLTLLFIIAIILFVGIVSLFNKKSHFLLYHEIKMVLLGNKYEHGDNLRKYYTNKEILWFNNDSLSGPKLLFRPDHLGGYISTGLTIDINDDGVNEIITTGDSKKIYCIDVKNNKVLWYYKLPFGRISSFAYQLFDVNNDEQPELIIGSHTVLPIRVYCLSIEENPDKRVLWKTNIHGDFIQGGLIVLNDDSNEPRIVAASRDASYSRGSINILDGKGNLICGPIFGVDVCNCRPSVGDIDDDGDYDFIIGSHKYYGAKYGWKVNAFDLESGSLLWSTPVGFDTGYLNFPITDFYQGGNQEVIAVNKILDAKTGIIIDSLNSDNNSFPFKKQIMGIVYKGDEPYSIWGDNGFVSYKNNERILNTEGYPFSQPLEIFDINNDGLPESISLFLIKKKKKVVSKLFLIDPLEGGIKDSLEKELSPYVVNKLKEKIPAQVEFEDALSGGYTGWRDSSYVLKEKRIDELPDTMKIGVVACNVDDDNKWEVMGNVNNMLLIFDTPYIISSKYSGQRLKIGSQTIDNYGYIWDYSDD